MRRPTFYRPMHLPEASYAYDVFHGTLPRTDQIGIGDGLGFGDRPWTDEGFDAGARMPAMRYQVNVGDMASLDLTSTEYFGGFGRVCDTFIHELTHVWQYAHGDFVKSSSVAAQVWESLTSDVEFSRRGTRVIVVHDAYAYAPLDHDKAWDDYNAEQQAHIVEDWNLHGRSRSDDLFPFISEVIRSHGDPRARGQSLAELRRHLYIPTPPTFFRLESPDPVLLPILAPRYAATDVAGFGGRVRRLEDAFRALDPLQARALLGRLTARRNGDTVSIYFHDHLSTATRVALLGTLRSAAMPPLL